MDQNTLALLTALGGVVAALAAFLVQPLVAWLTAALGFKLGISQFRQKWIEQLRDLLSEFMTEASHLSIEQQAGHVDPRANPRRTERIMLLDTKISLMLNRHEADHRKLLDLTFEIVQRSMLPTADTTGSAYGERLGEYVKLSQDILKREWDRLKNGK